MRWAVAAIALLGCGRLQFDDVPRSDALLVDAGTPASATFTWIGGASTINKNGIYGTRTIPDPANVPGSRDNGGGWVLGNEAWLFGGHGFGLVGGDDVLNDLWRYNLATREWTWMSGANNTQQAGVYETMGVPSNTAVPGARNDAATWTGGTYLYMFGGDGFDVDGNTGVLGDVWRFEPAAKQWAWIGGASTRDAVGAYGPGGAPGGRSAAAVWQTTTHAYVYGGVGVGDTTAVEGKLSDLWSYDLAMETWTLEHGDGAVDVAPRHGTLGVPSATNTPGGRDGVCVWGDDDGNAFLFGGYDGADLLAEMWRYTNGMWTWLGGEQELNTPPRYGTRGVPHPDNTPGGRRNANCWRDANGNLWLFGGLGFGGSLADLWVYTTETNTWTWIGGSMVRDAPGVYGELDMPSAANHPGARSQGITWQHPDGSFLLFGADFAYDSVGNAGSLNDLWRIVPE